ncbi:MAG: hypothetical protein NTY66_00645 [Candidatus Vogelbacteria bacterium]|nr:hypothetical protein [Candidatus Vogelbacteria bacterium]
MDEQTPKANGRRKATVCTGSDCSTCGCGGRAWACQQSCVLTRWILGLVIIVLVFWCGLKVGELKNELRGNFGRGYDRSEMMNSGWRTGGRVLMLEQGIPVTGSTETTTAKTGTKK